MTSLPLIVGFGGYNAAGRSSFHHAYERLIFDALSIKERRLALANLAILMGIVHVDQSNYVTRDGRVLSLAKLEEEFGEAVLNSTLVRRIEREYFDVDSVPWQQEVTFEQDGQDPIEFVLAKKQLPNVVPEGWVILPEDNKHVRVRLSQPVQVKIDNVRALASKAAGQFPSGFDPTAHYNARFHPRSLQMTILGASDAINSCGIAWQTIADAVSGDEVAVYSSNIMGQLDEAGLGGMLTARLKGKRISSKQCPLGHNSMTADFINAYLLGSVGTTGSITGACASFLYNLKAGIEDIQSGRRKVVLVGNSETPITPEIIDGYASMGALATEEGLRLLEESDEVDFRRSSRPFGQNCGFTIAESSQYVLLMDDKLAMELGANIYAAVTDVFVNADGVKQSISTPGVGNTITMAKAVASAVALLGKEAVQEHSFIQAHGSSTPLNRVTESKIYHEVAKAFQIKQWPVTAVKSYLGHSLAAASGDQLSVTLGVFAKGILPCINTIEEVADDVADEFLQLPLEHIKRKPEDWQVAFLNSKGFGGNNASAVVVSPYVVKKMMLQRYGEQYFKEYESRLAFTNERAQQYDEAATKGQLNVIYRYGEDPIADNQVTFDETSLHIAGFAQPINLPSQSMYQDCHVATSEEERLLEKIRMEA
ncbi:MAG: beta-ketoacyl synthase [Gammaproteobacteria bacterium]|nr:beta-ketoacyl synthase [Gammaproteobacteria bacterium]